MATPSPAAPAGSPSGEPAATSPATSPATSAATSGWRPTAAHVRACALVLGLTVLGVLTRRPDLLVLAAPFALAAGVGTLTRPRGIPRLRAGLAHSSLRENEATTWRAHVDHAPGITDLAAHVSPSPWVVRSPATGGVCTSVPDGADEADVAVDVQTTRWGRRPVGPAMVAAHGPWGAFRWGPVFTEPVTVLTLPLPALFDATAPTPHPRGLVGLNRSSRPGEGAEFESIRRFHPGDRLRRVHWPVSLRTGELHVASTWADQDSHVMLVVDALNDVGESGGIDGAASSLDTTVRAAGALADYFLRHGDRVGLRVVGAARVHTISPGSGRSHLRRVLDTLASVEVATDRNPERGRTPLGLAPGATVIMLSALVSWRALEQAIVLGRRGMTVIVVDTLPPGVRPGGTPTREDGSIDRPAQLTADVAWRIRLLERDLEIRTVTAAGIPVVPWRGPGSLDLVLRNLARRARAPRLAGGSVPR